MSTSKSWVAQHIAALPKSGIRAIYDIMNTMDDVVSLCVGEPDFETPVPIRQATVQAIDQGITHYTANLGYLELRQEICKYVKDRFQSDYDPAGECIVTIGVSEALTIVMQALLNPGDEVLFHQPGFVAYAPTIRMMHGVPVAVQTYEKDNFVLQVEELEKKVTPKTRALLINYPNNPTGAGLSWEDKQKIADFVIRHDLFLISDEIYEELSYVPRSPSITSIPGMKERSVMVNGFSKSFAMTGYRMGFACGPHELIDAMMKVHQYSIVCNSSFCQKAALTALRSCGNYRDEMRAEYQKRKDLIVDGLNNLGLHCFMPSGAFYVFPCIQSTGLDSMTFAMRLLKEKKVAVVPGTAFGPCGEGFIRCSYATSLEGIQKALERMSQFLDSLK